MAGNGRAINFNSLRNLPQYKNKTDDEIAEILELREQEKLNEKITSGKDLETRIQEKLEEFEKDYDISDLKYNDKEILRSMMIALISLEDLDIEYYSILSDGVGADNLLLLDKVRGMSSKLMSDISKMQDDLKISRKIRKSNKEESVINYIEDLKQKAIEFAETRMHYIFCPKCNLLLSTVWLLYDDEKMNTITLKCNRKVDDGDGNEKTCGEVVKVNLVELKETKSNKPKLLPETIR